jgi:hypothetical protein
MNLEDIVVLAREHADSLSSDIELCKDREEHVRITARANEAEQIAQDLYDLHISILAGESIG